MGWRFQSALLDTGMGAVVTIRAQLTPDDPPRERAAFLLKKIGA